MYILNIIKAFLNNNNFYESDSNIICGGNIFVVKFLAFLYIAIFPLSLAISISILNSLFLSLSLSLSCFVFSLLLIHPFSILHLEHPYNHLSFSITPYLSMHCNFLFLTCT